MKLEKVLGDYVCTDLLDKATTGGAVFKAHHIDDPTEEFAVRMILLPERNVDEILVDCQDHLMLVTAIDVPHTIPVVDFGHQDNEFYMVMPYSQGHSLRSLYKRTDRSPEAMPSYSEILRFAQSLTEALEQLHSVGIGHGLLDPRNIIVSSDKNFFLADIGVSRLMKIVLSLQTTSALWTGKYTAPEVWEGTRITPESDQYSLACVLYLLITGRAPFQAKTIAEMMGLHKEAIITPPHYIRKDAPASLTMFFLTATAKIPDQRFRSFTEFLNEFAACLEDKDDETTDFFDITSN